MNRSDLRAAVRRHLADTDRDPQWGFDQLNCAIAEAVRRYSTTLPRAAVWSIVLPVGTREIELPRWLDPLKIHAVVDDLGVAMRHWQDREFVPCPLPYGVPGVVACWRCWADAVILARPTARTGVWQLRYVVSRQEPRDDDRPLDIDPGDESLVIALAVAILLERRAVDAGRRSRHWSSRDPLVTAANAAGRAAIGVLEQRRDDQPEPWPSTPVRWGMRYSYGHRMQSAIRAEHERRRGVVRAISRLDGEIP